MYSQASSTKSDTLQDRLSEHDKADLKLRPQDYTNSSSNISSGSITHISKIQFYNPILS